MALVIDNHLYPELMADPATHRDRLLTIVAQLASRFRGAPDGVLLEVLNEPHADLDPLWNAYLAELLAVVRQDHPTRPVIVGPGHFNTVLGLPRLDLPASDRHLIVTIHQSWPLEFTFRASSGSPRAT
jgi:endoglucanase